MRLIIILTAVFVVGCAEGGESSPASSVGATNATALKIGPGTYTLASNRWCTEDSCNFLAPPPGCAGLVTFLDFTIYSDTSATFFHSEEEDVLMNTESRTIVLSSNKTGNMGLEIYYDYHEPLDIWYVGYGKGCGRVYRKTN